jgi:hypothetical protein
MAQGENPFGSNNTDSSSLRGDIYYLPEGASALPDFSSLTPMGSIYTKVLDVPQRSFTSGFPGVTDRFEWFAIRYTGSFQVDREGDYAFRLVSDDGSRLFIDGKKIIDNDGAHAPQSVSGSVYLSKGTHQIEVDYFQGPRDYVALQLFWTLPGGSETISNPEYVPGFSSSVPSSPGGSSTGNGQEATTGLEGLDLTGVWDCDDGGTYYLRQSGDTLWWFGEPSYEPGGWSNVAIGIISGDTIDLDWSDVPKGSTMNDGYGPEYIVQRPARGGRKDGQIRGLRMDAQIDERQRFFADGNRIGLTPYESLGGSEHKKLDRRVAPPAGQVPEGGVRIGSLHRQVGQSLRRPGDCDHQLRSDPGSSPGLG